MRKQIIADMTPDYDITIGYFKGKDGVAQGRVYGHTAKIDLNVTFMQTTSKPQIAELGLLTHELGHIRYDSFPAFVEAKRIGNKQNMNVTILSLILNIVEDGRIEFKISNDFPQYYEYLKFVKKYEDVNDMTIKFAVNGKSNIDIAHVLKGFYIYSRQGDIYNTSEGRAGAELSQRHIIKVDTAQDALRAAINIYHDLTNRYGNPGEIEIVGLTIPHHVYDIIEADYKVVGYE